MKQLLKLKEL